MVLIPAIAAPAIAAFRPSVQVKRRKLITSLAHLAATDQPHAHEALATLLSPKFHTSHAHDRLARK